MIYIHDTTDIVLRNTCITLGKFDGLHRGHQVLLNKLKEYENQGYQSVMFTFDFLPYNLFSETPVLPIYSEEEKRLLLEGNGPQVMISYPFTKETAETEAESFISEILIKKLDARVIVVGEDFRFGKNRCGDVRLLTDLSKKYGYNAVICEKLRMDGEVVSSTRIRDELNRGNNAYAEYLLGKDYFMTNQHSE